MHFQKSTPLEEIDDWDKVFNEVTLNVLPVDYVQKVLINFKDGKSWEIGIAPKSPRKKLNEFKDGLFEILDAYEDHIDHIDVKIDTSRVRKDVEKSIKKMLRKINL